MPLDPQEQVDMVLEKNQVYFSMMHGMNMRWFFLKNQNLLVYLLELDYIIIWDYLV